MKLCILLCLVTLAVSAPLALEKEWEQWKRQHGKTYSDEIEESVRRSVWFRTFNHIQEHNSAGHPYKLKLNNFYKHELSTLPIQTQQEFKRDYLSSSLNLEKLETRYNFHQLNTNITCPSSMDWRTKGFVTDVKDGGRCYSSWAFSAAGALEGQLYKATRTLTSLSKQQLLDCSIAYGNNGCGGGTPYEAFTYVHDFGGICRELDYPYLGFVYTCSEEFCSRAATCSGYSQIPSYSEDYLLDATYNVGLISVAVDASSTGFTYYYGGIYYDLDCVKTDLNHAMLVVGYGTDSSIEMDYWILKNSWGEDWGDRGYMKLARNQNNMCGIATAATYPML